MPHRLAVLGRNESDVVHWAGGLLCDRVMSGWRVDVYLVECADERPLRILGFGASDFSEAAARNDEESGDQRAWPDAMVVSPELYGNNARIRHHVGVAVRRHRVAVAVWGGDWPVGLPAGAGRLDYTLSEAAKAFKAHAMVASGAAGVDVSPTESYRANKQRFALAV